jgi:hypothetical protein
VVQVGFGRSDITPPLGTLCALGVDDEALEIFDPVHVRATLLGQGQEAVAILSLDVIGLYWPEMDDLAGLIAASTGLKHDRIIGWIDPYARMLVFTDPASGREHWLLNYACHPTAASDDEAPYITGDFPGNAVARIEATRSRVTCNYLTGCCGNINPGKCTGSSNEPAARAADVVRLGGQLAEAVVAGRERNLRAATGGTLRWARCPVSLPLLPRVRVREQLEGQLEREARVYAERRSMGQCERGGGTALFRTVYNLVCRAVGWP